LGKNMVPTRLFFTKGVGKHRERLTSFELALRDAGIAAQNLVRVSSIFPPHCKLVTRKEGLKYLNPGEVVFAEQRREDELRELTGYRMLRLIWGDYQRPRLIKSRFEQLARRTG